MTRTQHVILDAATKACVIRGTLTALSGAAVTFTGGRSPLSEARALDSHAKPRRKPTANGPSSPQSKDLQMQSLTEPSSALSQLDRELRELTREHGHVLRLDEFRRHLDEHEQLLMGRDVPPPPPPCAEGGPEAASEVDRMRQLRAAIDRRLERGDTLDTVERELIAPSGLAEEPQSALWLYAWSHRQRAAFSQCQPRLSVRAALGEALLTVIGIYLY